MADLFGYTKPRVLMHVADAGEGIIFECGKCGHNTGWIEDEWSVPE